MSREPKTKPCGRCGTGKVMTGRQSMFNYKDASGRQVCNDCMMSDLLGRFTTRENG